MNHSVFVSGNSCWDFREYGLHTQCVWFNGRKLQFGVSNTEKFDHACSEVTAVGIDNVVLKLNCGNCKHYYIID